MSYSKWLKAGISVEVVPGVFLLLVQTSDGVGQGFYEFVPPQVPTFLFPAGPTLADPHYPWGQFVEPD